MGTLSRSGHIKIFHPGRMYMYTLRPVMDEVLREEMVKEDNKLGGTIPGGNFPKGSLRGGNFFLGGRRRIS